LFDGACCFLSGSDSAIALVELKACQLVFRCIRDMNDVYEGCYMQKQKGSKFRQANKMLVDNPGSLLIDLFHYLAVFVIGASIYFKIDRMSYALPDLYRHFRTSRLLVLICKRIIKPIRGYCPYPDQFCYWPYQHLLSANRLMIDKGPYSASMIN